MPLLSVSANQAMELMDKAVREKTPFVFVLDYELSRAYFVTHPLEQADIRFSIRGEGNATGVKRAKDYSFDTYPEPIETYSQRFKTIQTALRRGDSFLANLTVATPVNMSLTLTEVYDYALAPYKLHIPNHLVCFSPEPFVDISADGRISSCPMKGTIDASLPKAETLLKSNPKELAEHYTIVDLIRNDLSRVAEQVQVDHFRYTDRIETNHGPILQMSSRISGRLQEQFLQSWGSVFRQLLPAGSISGAPKQATMDAIAQAEGKPRGFYSGVFGYFNGASLHSAVMIRYVEQLVEGMDEEQAARLSTSDQPMFIFRSGGGITVHSQEQSEYAETQQKVYLPF